MYLLFRPVESESDSHFRRPEPENFDNPEKLGFTDLEEVIRTRTTEMDTGFLIMEFVYFIGI